MKYSIICSSLKPKGCTVCEKHLGLGLERSRSRLEAKIEGLGLVSVSGNSGKVSPRLDQTFKRLGLVSSRSRKKRSHLYPWVSVRVKPW